ncbi:MAG: FtsK/SpoIIIE domain-containing protein [Lachnospiraceae bacterium]
MEYLKKTALDNGYTRGMQLWLPVLPETLYLEELSGYEPLFDGSGWKQPEGVWKLSAMAGLSDDPVNQAQLPMEVDFAEGGHHAVCGTVASGKSTFLQTVLYALTGRYSPDWLNIYGIDFS